jgi:multidrug efflux system outer membrane protein
VTRRLTAIALSSVALLAAGCSFIPAYQRPAAPVAPKFPEYPATPPVTATVPASELAWQVFFTDARLRRLIELGLANNRDLRVAILNIERTRGLYQVQRADELPTVNTTGSRTQQRVPGSLTPTGTGYELGYYQVGVGVTAYEIDVFGRVRALGESALAQYLATEEARKATQIALVASIANAYLAVAADDELLALTRQTLASREESLRLTRLRFDAGVTTELDLRVAQTQLESTRASLVQFQRQRTLDENALTLLVGQPLPADLPPASGRFAERALADVPVGLPSDLLASRPDIRSAEQQLVAANANIGAARAQMFPRISLTGSLGTASNDLESLFSLKSRAWTFVPGVSLPIFDAGRNQANYEVSQVNRDIAVAQYEKAIQVAFREVADALAGRATLGEQLKALDAQAQAEAARLKLTEARIRGGVGTSLELLDAQRSLFTVQQSVIQLQLQQLQNQVNLYKALGGGWKDGKPVALAPVPGS